MVNVILLPMVCLLLFFVRIPNIYLLPINTSVLLTNNLARMLSLLIVFLVIFFKSKESVPRLKKINIFIFVFLITQTLSVVSAQNINSFLMVYKDIVFGIVIYIAIFLSVKRKNIDAILSTLFVICLVNLFWEACVYFAPNIVYTWGKTIFSLGYFQTFVYELNRGRYFADMLDEAFIPLAVYLYFHKKNNNHLPIFTIIYLVLISYIVIMSNWRTKLIIFIFSLLSTLLIFWKDIKKFTGYILIVFFSVMLAVSFSYSLSSNRNIFDRVLSPDDGFFATTDVSRINYWKDAIMIGSSHPIFGIGLGNYYDYLSQSAKDQNKDSVTTTQSKKRILIDDPHNLFMSTFASSGLLGLSSLVALLASFFFLDLNNFMKKNNDLSQTLISVFWLIFIYSLFNPWLYFAYFTPLLAIRGIIDAIHFKE